MYNVLSMVVRIWISHNKMNVFDRRFKNSNRSTGSLKHQGIYA